MVRTVISLDAEAKAWLDKTARQTGKTMTAVVREAVSAYRTQITAEQTPAQADLLEQSSGIWRRGDGLAWQNELRGEWDGR